MPITLAALAVAVLAVIAAFVFFIKARAASAESDGLKSHVGTVVAERDDLGLKVAALSKYQGILDAEGHASRIESEARGLAARLESEARAKADELVRAATAEAGALRTEANAQLSAAESEFKSTRERAATEARELRAKAEDIMATARREAALVIEQAQKRGEEIAGEALEAKGKADQYANTAQAMKNVIEGYGDKYIIPTFSLLDGLAEEFGFAEGGQKLKEARARTRRMIKDEVAAACDYVEAVRKSTAIDFVLDAFNGKVDTVLADVRHDNHGTLEQKIHDAFALVNHNGAAFRNARITPEYLAARMDELKWAVVCHELRVKERDEQRAIKERIREEEKAQREYERAIKEAAKEEETLTKLREKVQAEMAKASDEQKAKFEKQLAEVNERLRVAEEKNKRALSMAQQTRAGHVYIISNVGSFGENVYKIGMTRRLEPDDRIRELGDASVPFEFDVHAMVRSDDAPTLERALHKRFISGQINKVNPRKEFFRAVLHEIRVEVERLGAQAAWTMTAEATEYRESIAVEEALKSKKLDAKDWAERQLAVEAAPFRESIEGAA